MEEKAFVDNPANADLFSKVPSNKKRPSSEEQSSPNSLSKRAKTSGANEVGGNNYLISGLQFCFLSFNDEIVSVLYIGINRNSMKFVVP